MSEQAIQCKERSHTVPNEQLNTSKSLSISSKTTTIIKAEAELRKLKHLLVMQKQLHRNHQEYQKITRQIEQFELDLKRKRQENIHMKLQQLEARKQERQFHNKQSDSTLSLIKEENRRRRQKMESIIQMYKQQYDKVYNNSLRKRKEQMKFNIEEIRKHQSQYLKNSSRRFSRRIRTQHSDKSQQEHYNSPSERSPNPTLRKEDVKLLKIRQLVKKRKQYGQNAERLASSIKISKDMIQMAKKKSQSRGFDDNIDKYQWQKKLMHKPRLNTNLRGSIKTLQRKQIGKIATEASPVKQKLAILQNLANGYMVKYENGRDDALENMCSINLTRAQLLLNDI